MNMPPEESNWNPQLRRDFDATLNKYKTRRDFTLVVTLVLDMMTGGMDLIGYGNGWLIPAGAITAIGVGLASVFHLKHRRFLS